MRFDKYFKSDVAVEWMSSFRAELKDLAAEELFLMTKVAFSFSPFWRINDGIVKFYIRNIKGDVVTISSLFLSFLTKTVYRKSVESLIAM